MSVDRVDRVDRVDKVDKVDRVDKGVLPRRVSRKEKSNQMQLTRGLVGK